MKTDKETKMKTKRGKENEKRNKENKSMRRRKENQGITNKTTSSRRKVKSAICGFPAWEEMARKHEIEAEGGRRGNCSLPPFLYRRCDKLNRWALRHDMCPACSMVSPFRNMGVGIQALSSFWFGTRGQLNGPLDRYKKIGQGQPVACSFTEGMTLGSGQWSRHF